MKKFVTRKITKERASDIWKGEDCCEGILSCETGEWRDEGKYQYLEIVFQEKGFDGYWMLNVTRSGSYFSDYYYDINTTITQVEPVEITVKNWMGVREAD